MLLFSNRSELLLELTEPSTLLHQMETLTNAGTATKIALLKCGVIVACIGLEQFINGTGNARYAAYETL